MLTKFTVENFKGFKEKIVFDLSSPSNYGFNQEVIFNNCITKGVIYGKNSGGKSNLGLAIFDIVGHLTDNQCLSHNYDYYLNLNCEKKYAEFEYNFMFEGIEVRYRYRKSAFNKLVEEQLLINQKEMLYFDFQENRGYTALEGTEALNNTLINDSPISRLKFVKNNAILVENDRNRAFIALMEYVDKMLLFYSLDERGYQGLRIGRQSIAEGIIESGKLKDFQEFLRENDIIYELEAVELDGHKSIYCRFGTTAVNFFGIASTGTKSLAVFYYWYIQMRNASLVYIDEFDAFYHFELSTSIIKRLCAIKEVQIFATTHNTDIMSNDLIRPDGYFIIQDNQLRSIANSTDKELRKAHNLQKMYKAGAFNGK